MCIVDSTAKREPQHFKCKPNTPPTYDPRQLLHQPKTRTWFRVKRWWSSPAATCSQVGCHGDRKSWQLESYPPIVCSWSEALRVAVPRCLQNISHPGQIPWVGSHHRRGTGEMHSGHTVDVSRLSLVGSGRHNVSKSVRLRAAQQGVPQAMTRIMAPNVERPRRPC